MAADLKKNLAAQERLRTEERWLRATLESLPMVTDPSRDTPGVLEATTGPEPSRTVAETPVPSPREEESMPPAAAPGQAAPPKGGTKAVPKKASARKAAAAQTAARKNTTARSTSRKRGGPTLGELVLAVLHNNPGEPRTATEVAEDLAREYPERARDTNNVRNALEGLVAKSLIERSKQKHTVHYTVQGQRSVPDPADGTATEPFPAADAAASEKVPGSA
ncbi:hypothetical protein SUDANB66_06568 (plasmid) [Streptomyces sp. SudanB66_2053]